MYARIVAKLINP